ncbi:MAG: hypothetical protein AAGJ38_06120 [Planctomycetota bacterium]
MITGLTVSEPGLCRVAAAPDPGRQHLGYPPGGPMDRFGMGVGNVMLEQDRVAAALEVIHTREIVFTQPLAFVLTGARRVHPRLHRAPAGDAVEVQHAVVTSAVAGDRLVLGPPMRGLRTYVCVRLDAPPELLGRERPPFKTICRTADADGAIRITPGPEYQTLSDTNALVQTTWKVTRDLSDVGVRLSPLEGHSNRALGAQPAEITSGPVADGTIQLTSGGPLVLMRQRPTLGGYPRVATVIDVDLDRLAQYTPGQALRFKLVSTENARAWYQQREQDLTDFAASQAR